MSGVDKMKNGQVQTISQWKDSVLRGWMGDGGFSIATQVSVCMSVYI